jgi:hypothetical protein
MRMLQRSLLQRDLEIGPRWRVCSQKLNVVVMTLVQ